MTGPEHYREAERLLAQAKAEDQRLTGQRTSVEAAEMTHRALDRMVADAQVHATLAQTAAMAIAFTSDEPVAADADAWRAAIGSAP